MEFIFCTISIYLRELVKDRDTLTEREAKEGEEKIFQHPQSIKPTISCSQGVRSTTVLQLLPKWVFTDCPGRGRTRDLLVLIYFVFRAALSYCPTPQQVYFTVFYSDNLTFRTTRLRPYPSGLMAKRGWQEGKS